MSSSYDGSLALPRSLTDEENKELRVTLMPYFHASGADKSNIAPEDIHEFLDYGLLMMSNQKPVDDIINELAGMEMDVFPPEVAEKVGKVMSEFIQSVLGENPNDAGDKNNPKQEKKGNALTMSGALGASREGGRARNDDSKSKASNKNDRSDRNQRDKGRGRGARGGRGGDRQNGREGRGGRQSDRGRRSIQKDAFDRLSRGGGSPRETFDRRRDGRGGREDRGRLIERGENRGGGRGGRDVGRGTPLPGRSGRFSGNRRGRNEHDNDEFMAIDAGRGRGRGRGGRGRSAPDGPNKRPRYEEGHYEKGHHDDGSGYDYDNGHGRGGHPHPAQRGGRGRGRFSGRGRGRGGRFEHYESNGAVSAGNGEHDQGSGVDHHPSPMVQASFSTGRANFGYSYGGRGRFGGRGRGSGRTFPGRAEVVNMIQSKTWVRKKEEDGGEGEPSIA